MYKETETCKVNREVMSRSVVSGYVIGFHASTTRGRKLETLEARGLHGRYLGSSEQLQLSPEEIAGEYSIHFTRSSSKLILFYKYLVFNIEYFLDKYILICQTLCACVAHM